MKKIFLRIICSLFALLIIISANVSLAEATTNTQDSRIISDYIEVLEDGSYYHITVIEDSVSSSRATQTISGSKHMTYYDADNIAQWKFTVHGTFQFIPGSSAGCASSSYSVDIYDSSWKNTAASAYASGNHAIGDATFKKYVLSIPTQTENVSITLTCTAYGTLS